MKIVKISELFGTEREVNGVGFTSFRPILEKDGMGFSLHETRIKEGGPYHWHYKNHLEACYCISGMGLLKNLDDGSYYNIVPGTTYLLDKNDNHTFEAYSDVILISVFNPPIKGGEIHKEDGSYEV